MRIAQVSPLYESVPPKLYGGTERIVHYLTEELVLQGHDVTLFASGDSQTSARLVPVCHEALRRQAKTPVIFTLHGRLGLPELRGLYEEFAEMPVVSISDSQRSPLPGANW